MGASIFLSIDKGTRLKMKYPASLGSRGFWNNEDEALLERA